MAGYLNPSMVSQLQPLVLQEIPRLALPKWYLEPARIDDSGVVAYTLSNPKMQPMVNFWEYASDLEARAAPRPRRIIRSLCLGLYHRWQEGSDYGDVLLKASLVEELRQSSWPQKQTDRAALSCWLKATSSRLVVRP